MAEFTVNGQTVSVGDHHDHLLAALRDELRVFIRALQSRERGGE